MSEESACLPFDAPESASGGFAGSTPRKRRLRIICGVDEAGRGPLAGPVYAAAVVLNPRRPIPGLADSKALSEARREALAESIRERAKAWCVGVASVNEIDTLNILQASMLAMQRAIEGLAVVPDLARVDGNRAPRIACAVETVIGGDARVPAISAASILAKTERDKALRSLHERYPEYGFDQHKGYGTALHLERLQRYGVCPEHRRSFAPVRRLLPAEVLMEAIQTKGVAIAAKSADARGPAFDSQAESLELFGESP